jgi:hypothetical protein
MTLFRLMTATAFSLIVLALPSAAQADAYVAPEIPLMPTLITPVITAATPLAQSPDWVSLVALDKKMSTKAKCIRKKKRCKVSSTQLDTWDGDASSYYDGIQSTIINNYDKTKASGLDSLIFPQQARSDAAARRLADYRDTITAEEKVGTDAANTIASSQYKSLDAVYIQIENDWTCDATTGVCGPKGPVNWTNPVTGAAETTDFATLNSSTCATNNPAPEDDPVDKTNPCADEKAALVKAQEAVKAKPTKANKEKAKKAQKAVNNCRSGALTKKIDKIRNDIKKLSKKDKHYQKKHKALLDALDKARADLAAIETYNKWLDAQKEWDDKNDAKDKERADCNKISNKESADEWYGEQEKVVEANKNAALKASEDKATARRKEVDSWSGRINDLNVEASSREKDNVQTLADTNRKKGEDGLRRIRVRTQALLRSLQR